MDEDGTKFFEARVAFWGPRGAPTPWRRSWVALGCMRGLGGAEGARVRVSWISRWHSRSSKGRRASARRFDPFAMGEALICGTEDEKQVVFNYEVSAILHLGSSARVELDLIIRPGRSLG